MVWFKYSILFVFYIIVIYQIYKNYYKNVAVDNSGNIALDASMKDFASNTYYQTGMRYPFRNHYQFTTANIKNFEIIDSKIQIEFKAPLKYRRKGTISHLGGKKEGDVERVLFSVKAIDTTDREVKRVLKKFFIINLIVIVLLVFVTNIRLDNYRKKARIEYQKCLLQESCPYVGAIDPYCLTMIPMLSFYTFFVLNVVYLYGISVGVKGEGTEEKVKKIIIGVLLGSFLFSLFYLFAPTLLINSFSGGIPTRLLPNNYCYEK